MNELSDAIGVPTRLASSEDIFDATLGFVDSCLASLINEKAIIADMLN